MDAEITTPDCPECGDMMGYPSPQGGNFLIWTCRACGSSFVYDDSYQLQPYTFLELLVDEV